MEAEVASDAKPEMITASRTQDDIIQTLYGVCNAFGDSCGTNGDCCAQCCINSVCLPEQVCEGICIPTSLAKLAYCNEDAECCEQCCADNECKDPDSCPKGLAMWLIWVLSILGGALVIVIVVLIIMCVVKRSRDASQKEAIYSSVD